jgi:hypothetical protein
MLCKWEKIGTEFTTTAYGLDGMKYNLRVERLPTRGWDWAVWRAGYARTSRHGCTTSAKRGMAAAESAVADQSTYRQNEPTRQSNRSIAPFSGLHSRLQSTIG